MAAAAAGQGFSILSPRLLLEGMTLRINEMPLPPLKRSIILVNRSGELDRLRQRLARALRARRESLRRLDPVAQQAVSFDNIPGPA